VLIRRQNRWYIELAYLTDEDLSTKPALPPFGGTRVFDIKNKKQPIAEIDELPAGNMVRLPEGDEIEIELKIGTETLQSPILKP